MLIGEKCFANISSFSGNCNEKCFANKGTFHEKTSIVLQTMYFVTETKGL
jgi:hypothetical protein